MNMKNIFITTFLLMCAGILNSCFKNSGAVVNDLESKIKTEILLEIVETFKIDDYEGKNIHIFYNEILNDSTWLVTFRQNAILGSEELGLCEFYFLKDIKIFVYKGDSCRIELNDSLKCKPDEWPIEFDGIHFNLLVGERKGKLMYYKLVRDFKFDEEEIESDSSDLNLMEL